MAQIDLIYAKSVEEQLNKILPQLEAHHKKIIDISKTQIDFFGGKTAKSPADLGKVETQYNKIVTSIEKTRLAEIKLQQAREKAFDKYEAQFNKEKARLSQANSLYYQTQQKVNELTKSYNNLAIKRELGQQLTTKELNNLSRLTKEINTYQTALKKVDADIQKNGRNVGNYASGWNGLGNSINQLSREMPAFANSVQTGFMALSNNLPILFDEISRIKTANKELIAQGKPIQSLFSQMAGAIFSVGTLLSVGVTLLTLYGAKIWDSISGSKAKKEALEKEKKALEDKIQAEKDQNTAIGQSIAQEQNRSRILFDIAKNDEVSTTKRKEALDELRGRYGKYLKDLSDQQILAGETAKAEEELNRALVGRGYALATQNLLEQNLTKQMEAQVEFEKATRKSIKGVIEQKDAQTGAIKNNENYFKSLRNNAKVNIEASKTLEAKLKPLKEEEEALLSLFNENAKYLDAVNENSKADKKTVKEKREVADAIELTSEKTESLLDKLKEQITLIKELQNANSKNNQEWLFYQKAIDGVQKAIDEIINGNKELQDSASKATDELKKQAQATKDNEERMVRLKEITDAYLLSFAEGFFGDAGLPTLFKILNDEIVGFGTNWAVTFTAMAEVAKEAFQYIEQASLQKFERQKENLNAEYELSVKLAGDNADAKAEIDRQYEAKLREIRRREFKAKQRLAIVEANINIAQGIIASLSKGGVAGIVMAGVIGALGVAQLLTIQNQEMPEYWMGTENAKEGIAKTQERGREFIFHKSGKLKSTGSEKGTQLTKMDGGETVWDANKTRKALDAMMHNQQLNNILASNGIGAVTNNNNRLNDERIVNALNSVEFAVKNIPVGGTELINGEMINYIQRSNTKTIITNSARGFKPNKL